MQRRIDLSALLPSGRLWSKSLNLIIISLNFDLSLMSTFLIELANYLVCKHFIVLVIQLEFMYLYGVLYSRKPVWL